MASRTTNWQADFSEIIDELRARAPISALRQMHSLLTHGASPLELAHRTQTVLPKTIEIIRKLSDYGLVQADVAPNSMSTSTSATFPESSVYHLTSDGMQFFRDALTTSRGTTRTT